MTEKQPLISVIVPVYKVEQYIRQCLDSIVDQTYKNLDILLIDDGSPDRCGEICEEYAANDKRIRVFHNEDNRGLSAARNRGLGEATGEYIGFVDSDDWIEPDMYERLLSGIKQFDIVSCGNLENAIYDTKSALIALLEGKIGNTVWNKLYRKTIFLGFMFPEGNHEDIASMHWILNKANNVVTITDILYHYRGRLNSITKTYSACNLVAYANAFLNRFAFFEKECSEIFNSKREDVLCCAAIGISRLWRWWFACTHEEKRIYDKTVYTYLKFSQNNFPIFGYHSWPRYLRVSSFFMHSKSPISFAVLYGLNQLFRKTVIE